MKLIEGLATAGLLCTAGFGQSSVSADWRPSVVERTASIGAKGTLGERLSSRRGLVGSTTLSRGVGDRLAASCCSRSGREGTTGEGSTTISAASDPGRNPVDRNVVLDGSGVLSVGSGVGLWVSSTAALILRRQSSPRICDGSCNGFVCRDVRLGVPTTTLSLFGRFA